MLKVKHDMLFFLVKFWLFNICFLNLHSINHLFKRDVSVKLNNFKQKTGYNGFIIN